MSSDFHRNQPADFQQRSVSPNNFLTEYLSELRLAKIFVTGRVDSSGSSQKQAH
jgi:hypothetical protein